MGEAGEHTRNCPEPMRNQSEAVAPSSTSTAPCGKCFSCSSAQMCCSRCCDMPCSGSSPRSAACAQCNRPRDPLSGLLSNETEV